MMNRLFLFSLLLIFPITYASAQKASDAREILDKTAKAIKSSGDMEVNFKASSFTNEKQKGDLSGTICLKGKKFNIISPNLNCWYNGKTLWSLNKETNEVNLSIPDVREKQSMNPYLFVDMYKDGYSYSLSNTTLRGKSCYEITLTAQNSKKDVQEMILTIDKQTNMPLCVRMRQGKNYWVRLTIKSYKPRQKYANSQFEFNSKDYPTATIVDIR